MKVLSWNVEHFKGKADRFSRILKTIKNEAPDIFALYEVTSNAVLEALTLELPSYQFHITEGAQQQEILVGVRGDLTAFVAQRTEFKKGSEHLRPGALLTLKFPDYFLNILFLHLKSSSTPYGFGVRDEQLQKAAKLKKALDKKNGGHAKLIVLGDLNIMGFDHQMHPDAAIIRAEVELLYAEAYFERVGMRRLSKSHPFTWSNGSTSKYPDADLDQVFASDTLEFPHGKEEVIVRGWPETETQEEADAWIRDYSDHAYLTFEVKI